MTFTVNSQRCRACGGPPVALTVTVPGRCGRHVAPDLPAPGAQLRIRGFELTSAVQVPSDRSAARVSRPVTGTQTVPGATPAATRTVASVGQPPPGAGELAAGAGPLVAAPVPGWDPPVAPAVPGCGPVPGPVPQAASTPANASPAIATSTLAT